MTSKVTILPAIIRASQGARLNEQAHFSLLRYAAVCFSGFPFRGGEVGKGNEENRCWTDLEGDRVEHHCRSSQRDEEHYGELSQELVAQVCDGSVKKDYCFTS